jgi:hypothetical protein
MTLRSWPRLIDAYPGASGRPGPVSLAVIAIALN